MFPPTPPPPRTPLPTLQALGNYLQLNEEQPLSTLRCFFSIPPLLILSTPLAIFLLFKPGFSPTNLFISQAVIKHHCVPRAGPDPQGLERGGGEVSGVQGRGQCYIFVGTTACSFSKPSTCLEAQDPHEAWMCHTPRRLQLKVRHSGLFLAEMTLKLQKHFHIYVSLNLRPPQE